MNREQLHVNNGVSGAISPRGDREGPLPVQGDEAQAPMGLGDVAKAAVEHMKLIVDDTMALGKLEARRVVLKAEQTAKDIAPRVAVGAAAVTLALAGVVLALVALFIALGEVIPSQPVRLVIFAGTFLALAAAGVFYVTRPLPRHDEKIPVEKVRPGSLPLNQDNPLASGRPLSGVSQ